MDTSDAQLVTSAPLTTDAAVIDSVARLIDQDARSRRSAWLIFLDRDAVIMPVVAPVDDVPERPAPEEIDSMCQMISDVLAYADRDGSAVVALTRPGPATPEGSDRYWCNALHEWARANEVPLRMVCLLTPDGVGQLIADDVGAGQAPHRQPRRTGAVRTARRATGREAGPG